jgi:transmembrane anterior posterior transformation protein 1
MARVPPSLDLSAYLRTEIFGIGQPGLYEPPVRENIHNFFLVPFKLESFICLGFFTSLDAFLYVLTFLPIRVVLSIIILISNIHSDLWELIFGFRPPTILQFQGQEIRFHRTQAYDLMRGTMLFVGCFLLRQINMSQVYHFIRGQSIIKLYVLAGMMEVMDKLMSSFGQDVFDALHLQTRRAPWSPRLIFYFLLALGYVCLHSVLYFFVVATLTVVINSADEALVTVLVINNFSEIRGFVFKKFDGNNLFQLTCSDATERFQIFLFLLLIGVVALAQAGLRGWKDVIMGCIQVSSMLMIAEVLADAMKHAFIGKFNSIGADVYRDFSFVLRSDLLNQRQDPVILDQSYAVCRRLGLAQV